MQLIGNRIYLEFATLKDKKPIYEMLVSPEVIKNMFDTQHPAPSWQEFSEDESDEFFTGTPSAEGSYLLIKYNGEIIGSISYANGYTKVIYSEIDIWISRSKYTGQGLGIEAINLLMEFIRQKYSINVFIIRPWAKNVNAIKAYKKCGFKEDANFCPNDYYSDEDVLHYGAGDYGVIETINLIKRYI